MTLRLVNREKAYNARIIPVDRCYVKRISFCLKIFDKKLHYALFITGTNCWALCFCVRNKEKNFKNFLKPLSLIENFRPNNDCVRESDAGIFLKILP
jgi:hypothetical protein